MTSKSVRCLCWWKYDAVTQTWERYTSWLCRIHDLGSSHYPEENDMPPWAQGRA